MVGGLIQSAGAGVPGSSFTGTHRTKRRHGWRLASSNELEGGPGQSEIPGVRGLAKSAPALKSLALARSGCHENWVGFRFFALPVQLAAGPRTQVAESELLTPELVDTEVAESALEGLEYRAERVQDRARKLLASGSSQEDFSDLGFGSAAVFARSPQDLPALLRLADQLERLARDQAGERALVWQCADCGTRYAVPLGLVRQVSIRCERCSRPVELTPGRALGEEALIDPVQSAINSVRRSLAEFFREAMARSWPVWVSRR